MEKFVALMSTFETSANSARKEEEEEKEVEGGRKGTDRESTDVVHSWLGQIHIRPTEGANNSREHKERQTANSEEGSQWRARSGGH